MSQYIFGIDPGASGAIAIIQSDSGKLIDVIDMPVTELEVGGKTKRRVSPVFLQSELAFYADDARAVVELVNAMPGQGVTSMFAFGEALGIVRGVLAGMKVPVDLVTPAKWKRDLKLNPGKDGARAMAANLWPDKADLFKRAKDDGRAEAALIAHWGRSTS
jgi:crossover junction endodeoxyribonuclease RuvC